MPAPIEVPLATSLRELRTRLEGGMQSPGHARALAFQAEPSDVFIATFPKCGTTWLQQIAHGLRTFGSMDFQEISQVTPWLERAEFFGWDPLVEQPARPRVFKTHLDWHDVPKGARYIYAMRDPKDVVVSFYHFLGGRLFDMEAIPIDVFTTEFFLEGSWPEGGYLEHIVSWFERATDEPVRMFCYEDLGTDLEATVRRVAGFMRLPLEPERIAVATRQASFEFMQQHRDKFTDRVPGTTLAFSKVRTGRVGDGRAEVSPRLLARLDEQFRSVITPALGFHDYGELREHVARSWGSEQS